MAHLLFVLVRGVQYV